MPSPFEAEVHRIAASESVPAPAVTFREPATAQSGRRALVDDRRRPGDRRLAGVGKADVMPRESVGVVAVCAAVLLAGCQHPAIGDDSGSGDHLRVTHVADGDTLSGLDPAGRRVRVRLLGIDTPEVAHDGRADECGAVAARDSLRDLVLHQDVTLVDDPRADPVDRYGRRLAYVDVRGVDAALHQVAAGYAEAWYPRREPRPDRHADYQRAQRAAQRGRIGAWARCPGLGR